MPNMISIKFPGSDTVFEVTDAQARIMLTSLQTELGTLSSLDTTTKTSLVAAINEIKAQLDQTETDVGHAVHFDDDQDLTSAQKEQARTNIDAAGAGEVGDLRSACDYTGTLIESTAAMANDVEYTISPHIEQGGFTNGVENENTDRCRTVEFIYLPIKSATFIIPAGIYMYAYEFDETKTYVKNGYAYNGTIALNFENPYIRCVFRRDDSGIISPSEVSGFEILVSSVAHALEYKAGGIDVTAIDGYSIYGNLLDYNNITENAAVQETFDSTIASTSNNVSNWIPVSQGDVLHFHVSNSPVNVPQLKMYDENRAGVGWRANTNNIVIPAGVYWVRFNFYKTWKPSNGFGVRKDSFNKYERFTGYRLSDKLLQNNYIVCWGDSLTAQGGWTTRLESLCGLPVFNGGTGGESVHTICARQGADAMIVNNITIPADTTPVVVGTMADGGIDTALGYKALPMLQYTTAEHVNYCQIGDVVGTLAWTGSNAQDQSGTWTFARLTTGDAVSITRPTAIRTRYDMYRNSPYIMVIFMGTNGGYDNVEDLINWHDLMIAHAHAKNVIVLGMTKGNESTMGAYDDAMTEKFGRHYISLRRYLVQYGLQDAGMTPTDEDTAAITIGKVPPQLFTDGTHYKDITKTVIGDLIYRQLTGLNMFV